jgi:TetR/AcrR family transcriptional regulator, cholesterol catabolism regulator
MSAAVSVLPVDREAAIIDAALVVLARDGIGGVSLRAVAREAGVALGLAHYYFADKTALIGAALVQIGEQDLTIVRPPASLTPRQRLRSALDAALDGAYLHADYLSLRLQLWSLAAVDESFATINRATQRTYRDELAGLIAAARPDLGRAESRRRAADILTIQNGVWLTAAIIDEPTARRRALRRCKAIADALPHEEGR